MLCQSLLPQLDVSVPDVKKRRGGERDEERERLGKKKPSAEACQVDKAFRFGDVFRGRPFPLAKVC